VVSATEGEDRPPLARWKLAVLAAGVAGGVFGVVTYVSADRPSPADDRRALEAALLSPGELGREQVETSREVSTEDRSVGILTGLDCQSLVRAEDDLLAKHGTAQIRHHLTAPGGPEVVIYLAAFDTPVAAQRHRDLVESQEVSACAFGDDGADRVVGRWWIHVVVTEAADDTPERALIDRIVDRVEIEG
jgi:hypothetical protein